MFDTGNLKLLATQLPAGALERPVPSLGWTVRQALAHLASAQSAYAASLDSLPAALPLNSDAFDAPRLAAARAVEAEPRPLPAILADFDSSLQRLVSHCNALGEEALACPVGERSLLSVIQRWSGHASGHAIQILGALPELRADPILLNWLLYQDFSAQPSQLALQQVLFAEVRARLAAGEEESNEEDLQ